MKIAGLYARSFLAIETRAPIVEAAAAMLRFRVPALLVTDPSRPGAIVGIVCDRDIALQGFAAQSSNVEEAMIPAAMLDEDRDVGEALELMRARGLSRLVVTAGGTARGIVSIGDIVEGLAGELAQACALLKAGDATLGLPGGDG
jgi:CBS domain-containing protein